MYIVKSIFAMQKGLMTTCKGIWFLVFVCWFRL